MHNGFHGAFRSKTRSDWHYKKYYRLWWTRSELVFLISGFLCGKTFFDNPRIDIIEYYKKRIIAILPLYYLVIVYYFISENIINQYIPVIPPDELGIGWWRYLFLLNGFLTSDTYFWSNLGITWTIPIFAFFYLIAPWILRRMKNFFSAVIVWGLCFVGTKILGSFYPCYIFENIHFLFMGTVIYVSIIKKVEKQTILCFSILSICAVIINREAYVYVLMFASIMLVLISMEKLILPDILRKIIDILEKYSYTMYLMHGVIFCSIIDRINNLNISKIWIVVIAITGTICSTWVIGKFIEKPIQKFLRKILFTGK